MHHLVEVRVPDIGDNHHVEIIEIFIKPGDTLALEDSLITLETDKATMDVPSTIEGTVKEVNVQLGSKVSQGDIIAMVEVVNSKASHDAITSTEEKLPPQVQQDTTVAPSPHAVKPPASAPPVATPITNSSAFDETSFEKVYASPSVRYFARELGVDLRYVIGTGEKKRITREDVQHFVKTRMADTNHVAPHGTGIDLLPWPQVDFAKFGPIETQPLSRIKKISGANLARNWVKIPHVTFNDEADITDLEAFRKTLNEAPNIKVSPLAFIIKAASVALQQFPELNASIEGDSLILKQYYHIGFAADTIHGLVVPVIRDVNQKGILQLAKELSELSALAREGKLKPTDMQGATFTISSLGGIGGTSFTPIINAPEVAILGVSKSQIKPIWDGNTFIPRLMCPLSLSIDHRVIDGAGAARFTVYLASLLADLRRLTL